MDMLPLTGTLQPGYRQLQTSLKLLDVGKDGKIISISLLTKKK